MSVEVFVSMKQLAIELGTTQKRIGLALDRLGLWDVGSGPTQKARDGGYTSLRYYSNLENFPLTVWHREKTLAALATIGLTRQ